MTVTKIDLKVLRVYVLNLRLKTIVSRQVFFSVHLNIKCSNNVLSAAIVTIEQHNLT